MNNTPHSSSPRTNSQTHVSRRTVAKGIAWSAPTIALASAAPAFAVSRESCKTGTLNWAAAAGGNTGRTKYAGGLIPIALADKRVVYARVTLSGGTTNTSTDPYNRTISATSTTAAFAWGTVVSAYRWPTSNGRDLVLNQVTNGSTQTVKIDFFSDSAGTKPTTVYDATVPLDDFSSATSWSLEWFTYVLQPAKSYVEAWTVQGTTPSGSTVTAALKSFTATPGYNSNSSLGNIRGSGTPSDPWYFPSTFTSAGNENVGGNVLTGFSTGVQSITITYGQGEKSKGFSATQGAGISGINICA